MTSDWAQDRADAADNALDTRISAYEAHRTGQDENAGDGPWAVADGAEMEPR